MKSKGLNSLPTEMMERIADFVDTASLPSLNSFALTNRACHEAALPFLWEGLRIVVPSDVTEFQQRLDALTKTISSLDLSWCIRNLHIHGDALNCKDFREEMDLVVLKIKGLKTTEASPANQDDYTTPWRGRYSQNLVSVNTAGPGQCYVKDTEAGDAAWATLSDLVKNLPHLKSLTYACGNIFPPRLLQAIHQYHPQCKLHLAAIQLNSPRKLHDDERAVMASSCLCSVTLREWMRPWGWDYRSYRMSVMMLVNEMPPNLEKLTVVSCGWPGTVDGRPWCGLPGYISGPLKKKKEGKLSLLTWEVLGTKRVTGNFLQPWSEHIEYSSLRRLDLGAGINEEGLEWMAAHRPFAQLKSLRARVKRNYYREYIDELLFDSRCPSFIESLPPLEELSLSGLVREETFEVICRRHGPTLTRLSFKPEIWSSTFSTNDTYVHAHTGVCNFLQPFILQPDHVRRIDADCPLLEHLKITVARLTPSEIQMYRSIGELRNVRTLALTLDCSSAEVNNNRIPLTQAQDEHDFYRQRLEDQSVVTNGDVRNALAKLAVDESLARSIFSIISHAKAGAGLQSLKLRPRDGGAFACMRTSVYRYQSRAAILGKVAQSLSLSWLVEQGPAEDGD
ncbi:hypothetical protein PspLS_09834 [Pyricularia sp. CBS 133598]|nr:hypothetical protein PspLS_09834 [Pyricularia sp. CBS 133598]